ncbi:hypothetical protein EHM94_17800 [Marinobacter sp. NP-6]|uniref:hypothetical protein n=1 Tax=Marinobacter sp. NP-6 TaxID=2488666 RepID=UPI000FCA8F1C|nr:hypothetical protein [Marinobacter sp. NP-6]RUT76888.1 hypothetical protein EHM94_17800 [Marinobacter sp. NP-6]
MSSQAVIYVAEHCQLPPRAVLSRLARALQACLRIPEDDSLVCFLGFGWEENNTQALETWIKNTLMTPDEEGVRLMLPWLLDRLERELLRMEASL